MRTSLEQTLDVVGGWIAAAVLFGILSFFCKGNIHVPKGCCHTRREFSCCWGCRRDFGTVCRFSLRAVVFPCIAWDFCLRSCKFIVLAVWIERRLIPIVLLGKPSCVRCALHLHGVFVPSVGKRLTLISELNFRLRDIFCTIQADAVYLI
jgi:hypothetical protein